MATKTLSNYLKHWHLRIRVYTVTWNLQVTGELMYTHEPGGKQTRPDLEPQGFKVLDTLLRT